MHSTGGINSGVMLCARGLPEDDTPAPKHVGVIHIKNCVL